MELRLLEERPHHPPIIQLLKVVGEDLGLAVR